LLYFCIVSESLLFVAFEVEYRRTRDQIWKVRHLRVLVLFNELGARREDPGIAGRTLLWNSYREDFLYNFRVRGVRY
jgi:hypothetical protein